MNERYTCIRQFFPLSNDGCHSFTLLVENVPFTWYTFMPLAYYSTSQSYQIPQIESVVPSVVIASRLALVQFLGSGSMIRISCCQSCGPPQKLGHLLSLLNFHSSLRKEKKNRHEMPSRTTQSMQHHKITERERELYSYKRTSHPLNLKNLNPYRFVASISLMTSSMLIRGLYSLRWCQIDSKKYFQSAYYFKALTLDEWEVHSYVIISSLPISHHFCKSVVCVLEML